jgi:transcriptional regulator with XRE-family HTH domain
MPHLLVNNGEVAYACCQVKVFMTTKSDNFEIHGARLREERTRFGLNQEDFGAFGGVTRNSQQAYEAGRRAFDISYLAHLADRGVDIGYVMTGDRSLPKDERPAELSLITMRVAMPPQPALAQMFAAVLQVYPDLHGDALAQALATHLPSGLAQLTDLQPTAAIPIATGPATPDTPPADRPAPRPARRS